MITRELTDSEWRALSTVEENSDQIRRELSRLLKSLRELFNDKTVIGITGLKFTESSDARIQAEVESTFGVGRLRLEWRTTEDHIIGHLILDRRAYDVYDKPFWEPCLLVILNPGKKWTLLEPGEKKAWTNWQDADRNSVLGMSMLHAIINGPSFI